jgi:uncharacterized membrane protein YhaH (DUF805 family)
LTGVDVTTRSVHFLFRTDQGRIDVKTWWGGSLRLGGIFALMTIAAVLSTPYMKHDLAASPFFAWSVIAAYVYIVIYVFALILIAICFYNLSAKRWRDRAKPSALAGLLPFGALLAGAAHWLYPQMGGDVPAWSVALIDIAFVALLFWTIIELGVMPSKLTQN